jgi:hypothetical protein
LQKINQASSFDLSEHSPKSFLFFYSNLTEKRGENNGVLKTRRSYRYKKKIYRSLKIYPVSSEADEVLQQELWYLGVESLHHGRGRLVHQLLGQTQPEQGEKSSRIPLTR